MIFIIFLEEKNYLGVITPIGGLLLLAGWLGLVWKE